MPHDYLIFLGRHAVLFLESLKEARVVAESKAFVGVGDACSFFGGRKLTDQELKDIEYWGGQKVYSGFPTAPYGKNSNELFGQSNI